MSNRSKKAAKTPPEPTAAPVGVLLARLPRSSLESLLTEAVKSGAVPLERIRQALPEAKHTLVIAKPKVSGGPTREGTGLFDALDDDLLVTILSKLAPSTGSVLTCCIAVCKAWVHLRACTALFEDLGLCPQRYSTIEGVKICSANVSRLLQFLPDAATTVRSLRIASGDKHASLAPDVLKKTLSHFKNLTSLDLGGKKATAAVFTLAAKQPWASTLESFTYRECGATPFDTVGLLGQATHLTSLSMTCDGVHIPPPHPTPPHPHSSP